MFLPDNIDLGQSEKYILIIRISPEKFAYSIHEPRIGGDFCYREESISKETGLLNEVQRIIFDFNFLTQKFKQTNVLLVSNEYELVPQYLIEKDKIQDLYNFTHHKKSTRVIQSSEKIQDNIVLFGFDEELYKFLVRSLFNPQFYHHSFFIMKYVDGKSHALSNSAKMFLNFHDNIVDIICYSKASRIQHILSLQNESEYNQVYHILNIWDKCCFDQKQDTLYILENSANKSESVINILKDYIKNIETIGAPNELEFLNTEENMQAPIDLLILSIA